MATAGAALSIATRGQERYSYTVSDPMPKPQIFGAGVISTGDYDTHPAFSPDGKTLYFLKCTADINTCTICVSHFKNNRWTEPMVAPFSGQYWDVDPFVTKDGKTVYFSSNRPLKEGDPAKADTDIWKVDVTSSGWGPPVRLDSPISSKGSEYYPTLADNGTIYFGSTCDGGRVARIFTGVRRSTGNLRLLKISAVKIIMEKSAASPNLQPVCNRRLTRRKKKSGRL